ncbi:MAG: hypothetical protein Fur0037_14700 [Planctomycetota bacterium]
MRTSLTLSLVALVAPCALAQSNSVPGLDGNLYRVDSLTYYGHEGSFPNGRTGMAMLNEMCNPGTVNIPWYAPMQPNHPKFGFMICRESNGRFEQISDRSFVKHAFLSTNYSGPCGSCQNPGTGALMGVHCADTYGAGNNADQYYLGPADEIDPWLGTWNPVGSYFDRGDPDVGPPQNRDGNRSLTRSQTTAFGPVKNRVIVQDADLNVPGATYYYCIHLVHEGEPVANRGNNLASRRFVPTWNGSQWNFSNAGSQVQGTWLQWWTGATYSLGGNGQDDGRFAVAVKVTGPSNGLWHYEYAVHNIDNSRGGASFRLPICGAARVFQTGFKDIDSDPLNQWTVSRAGGELVFTAPPSNPLDWNELFNFWFDSDAAPVPGTVHLDEARLGPGALDVAVASQVPMNVPNVWLGAGCGTPSSELRGLGIASSPNPSFALQLDGAPNTFTLLFYSWNNVTLPLPGGCTQYLDPSMIGTFATGMTNGSGRIQWPLPIPAGLGAGAIDFQAAQIQNGGPLFSLFTLSNGLMVRFGITGCP